MTTTSQHDFDVIFAWGYTPLQREPVTITTGIRLAPELSVKPSPYPNPHGTYGYGLINPRTGEQIYHVYNYDGQGSRCHVTKVNRPNQQQVPDDQLRVSGAPMCPGGLADLHQHLNYLRHQRGHHLTIGNLKIHTQVNINVSNNPDE